MPAPHRKTEYKFLALRSNAAAKGCVYMFERNVFSRDQWNERGRAVVVENSEARNVVMYWGRDVRGARHVFSEDQTLPVEQFSEQVAA